MRLMQSGFSSKFEKKVKCEKNNACRAQGNRN